MQRFLLVLVLLAISLSVQADGFDDFNDYPSTYTTPTYSTSGYNWFNEPISHPAYGTYTRSQVLSRYFLEMGKNIRGPQPKLRCNTHYYGGGAQTTCY